MSWRADNTSRNRAVKCLAAAAIEFKAGIWKSRRSFTRQTALGEGEKLLSWVTRLCFWRPLHCYRE
jgi:hypothetical protein